MAHVVVKGFGPGGAEENGTEQPEPPRVLHEQFIGVQGIDAFEHLGMR